MALIRNINKLDMYCHHRDVDFSACHAYRVATPFRTLQELGLANTVIDNGSMPAAERHNAIAMADIQHYYLAIGKPLLDRMFHFKTWRRAFDHTNRLRTPSSVVFDADDHVEQVDIFNPKFSALGTHLPDGTVLAPGARVHARLAEGPDELLWEDGQQYKEGVFDIERNLKKITLLKMIARQANGVTVTTEELAKVYRKYGCKNIHIFPNSLRRVDYPEIKIQRPRKKVRVLWQGGYSHFVDWLPLREALREVFAERPNAELWIWGMLFPGVHNVVPEKQLKYIEWGPYSKFTLRLATIGHHINLAPLVRNKFNDTKSPIKFLESSAIHTPAATLAADGPVYGPAIRPGETGLLYSSPAEFKTKLLALIDDAALRQKLANNAHEQVWDEFNAEDHVRPLYRWYQELRETRTAETDVAHSF